MGWLVHDGVQVGEMLEGTLLLVDVGTEESERMTVGCQSASQQSKQKQLELHQVPWTRLPKIHRLSD